MLELYEVNELEHAWMNYDAARKRKYKITFFILAALVLIVLAALAIYASFSAGRSEIIQANELSNQAAKERLEQAKIKALKQKIIHHESNSVAKVLADSKRPKSEESITSAAKTLKPVASLDAKEQEAKQSTIKEPASDLRPAEQTKQEARQIEQESKQNPKQMLPVINLKMPPVSKQPKANKKPVLTAIKEPIKELKVKPAKSSSAQSEIEYLKEKFAQSKSQYFALDIAKAYYAQKDYSNAQKWALTANNIDESNENSWLLFARAKAASGDKSEASKIIKTYLHKNPDSEAASLLLDELKGE